MNAATASLWHGRGHPLLWLTVVAGLIAGQPGTAAAGMNGPPQTSRSPGVTDTTGSAAASLPLFGAIRFFQEYISPADGARCQFSPTCSGFGHQAIHRHGPWLGVLMTTDRLMRCGYGTDPDLYPRLPNGRLADPVAPAPQAD